jgi:predicted TIM-barrel fold metal-dependent hydrolase
MLAMGERPLGRRSYWPIYRAAERHKLPIGIHAGSNYRHPPTSIGWPSYYLEDYVVQAQAFAAQLLSLVTEGVFVKFPELKIVMMESGVTWLPGMIWRADKTWRAVRFEVPWLHQAPGEVIRNHVRFTIQPLDAPPRREQLERLLEQLGSEDILLFSTDYPHWHFDGDDAVPDGLPDALVRKILFDNPLMTYPRLSQTAREPQEQAV